MTLGFYTAGTLIALAVHGWNPLWFVRIGERFAHLTASGTSGFDGQFAYYLAAFGRGGVAHLDNPPYRLQRILLPLLARLLSLGHSDRVAWTILTINAAALTASAACLGRWLGERNVSPWYALAYSLYIGSFLAFAYDLTEPLAFAFAAAAAICWLDRRTVAAIALFALAMLTKEITMLFVFGIAAAELTRRHPLRAGAALLAVVPFVAWDAYLFSVFRTVPLLAGARLEIVPLRGALAWATAGVVRSASLFYLAIPALGLAGIGLVELVRQPRSYALWWLVMHGVFVVLLPAPTYESILSAGRNATGLVLSVLFLFPTLRGSSRAIASAYLILPTFASIIPVIRASP